jgi:hypothetical protein
MDWVTLRANFSQNHPVTLRNHEDVAQLSSDLLRDRKDNSFNSFRFEVLRCIEDAFYEEKFVLIF